MISQQSVTASFPVKADAVLAACCVCSHSGIALSPSPGQWAVTWGGGPGQPPATWRGNPATEPRLPPLQNGVISLIDCTLVEEQESTDEDGRCPRGPMPVRLLLGHAQGPAQPPPVAQGRGVGFCVSQRVQSQLLQDPLCQHHQHSRPSPTVHRRRFWVLQRGHPIARGDKALTQQGQGGARAVGPTGSCT